MITHPDVDITELSRLTQGFSGAETVYICQEAGLEAMKEDLKAECVCRRHFLKALEHVSPRITPQMIDFYDNFRKTSGLKNL